MKQAIFLLVIVAAVFTVGCGVSEPGSKQANIYQGRKETVNVRALDAVGYNGTAVRKNVDKVLDMNDQRNQELEKALK